ncbi:glutamate--tRNA ligase [Candidatus Parcubacteria bacterium]|nr:glutamate--tRNA ligase [Candidatus Parcubacteria bacterium]
MSDKKEKKVRVRIAPSPTGTLHIGTARVALFNYLFAKQCEGTFILRIEDTDLERSEECFEKNIIEGLQWLGIKWDEGVLCDQEQNHIGNYGPYKQSERTDIYLKHIKDLLSKGKAYYCFCSKEELKTKKEYQMSIGQPPHYDEKCKQLSAEEIEKNIAQGEPFIVRFKTPIKKIVFNDSVRGKVEFDTNLIDDFTIAKGSGESITPLYHLAVVVDDQEMEISHVIRGEDHISNTPKQILLQEALEFPQPKYAHLPLILGPDKSKLSKRHGAVSISEYQQEGYLPETMINFMAFLGWNPGGKKEIYSIDELIEEFSLECVHKGGAMFNIQRLSFLNAFYIRKKPLMELTELCLPYLLAAGLIEETNEGEFKIKETSETIDIVWLSKIIQAYQERLKKLSEIPELTDLFFKEIEYDKELVRWKNMADEDIRKALDKAESVLEKIEAEDFNKENLQNLIMPEAEALGAGDRGKLLWPLRAVLTGKKASAGPFEIIEILGKEKTMERIEKAKTLFK